MRMRLSRTPLWRTWCNRRITVTTLLVEVLYSQYSALCNMRLLCTKLIRPSISVLYYCQEETTHKNDNGKLLSGKCWSKKYLLHVLQNQISILYRSRASMIFVFASVPCCQCQALPVTHQRVSCSLGPNDQWDSKTSLMLRSRLRELF